MKRAFSIIAVPAGDGGMNFAVSMMSYPNGTTPEIDFTADCLVDRSMLQDVSDDEVVTWAVHAIRRCAQLFELELTERPDKPAPWPVQLGLFTAD